MPPLGLEASSRLPSWLSHVLALNQGISMLQAAEDFVTNFSVSAALLTKGLQRLIDSGKHLLMYAQDRDT